MKDENLSDRNIEQLLSRSYKPPEPSKEFEERLFDRLRVEMRRLPAEASRRDFATRVAEVFLRRQTGWLLPVAADALLIAALLLLMTLPYHAPRPATPSAIESVRVEPRAASVTTETIEKTRLAADARTLPPPKTVRRPAAAGVPPMRVEPMSLASIEKLMRFPKPPALEADKAALASPAQPVAAGRPFEIRDFVNIFSRQVLRDASHGPTTVAVLIEAGQFMRQERRIIADDMHRAAALIRQQLSDKADNLKWMVASYARQTVLRLPPTTEVDPLRSAISGIPVSPSGKANVIHAIEYAIKRTRTARGRVLMLVVAAEEGTDTHDDARVDAVLADLKERRIRLYVFGKEAYFQQPRVPDWIRDENGERLGSRIWRRCGIESAGPEFFAPDRLFSSYSGRAVTAGFGSFILSMLARQTGGAYYILSDVPSCYDPADLAGYEPEWVTRNTYARRTTASEIRRALHSIVQSWATIKPRQRLTELHRLKAAALKEIRRADQAREFVEQAIARLENQQDKSNKERFAPKRWEANFELTLAELYKFRFLLRQYSLALRDCVRQGFPKPKRGKFNLYQICYDLHATALRGGARARRELAQARKALDKVAKKHAGTPWGEVARKERRLLAPLTVKPGFYIEPAPFSH